MPIVTKQIRVDRYYSHQIFAVASREGTRLRCPTLEFFKEQDLTNRTELDKLAALLMFTAKEGPPRNEQKFKQIEGTDGLYEFKTTSLRLFCFFDSGTVIICATGMVKKKGRHNPNDIQTALTWKQAYLQAKANNELSYEPEHS
jgi:Phage derived protein Gp49-like (DUF891)